MAHLESETGSDRNSSASTSQLPPEFKFFEPIQRRLQVDSFIFLPKQQLPSGKHGRVGRNDAQFQDCYSVTNMLSFQQDSIHTSVLQLDGGLIHKAIELFHLILRYSNADGGGLCTPQKEREIVIEIYNYLFEYPELRDEVFVQLMKQTSGNCNRYSLSQTWKLLFLCASAVPPHAEVATCLLNYLHSTFKAFENDLQMQEKVLKAQKALQHALDVGDRKFAPSEEEVEALLVLKKLPMTVYFLDDTFEDVSYDITTTVAELLQELFRILNLSAYETFGLYMDHKLEVLKDCNASTGEYMLLDDKEYMGDVLAELSKKDSQSRSQIKLICKKRLFLDSDKLISEETFLHLLYIQVQHDYLVGNYPVGRDDCIKLAALQILVKDGSSDNKFISRNFSLFVDRYIPKQLALSRPKKEWEADVLECYHDIMHLSKSKARQRILQILSFLPYGNSVFYNVKKITDPTGLLTGCIILAINKQGLHLFRPVPRQLLLSVDFCEIEEFGSNNSIFYFQQKCAGKRRAFHFDTNQGKRICNDLLTLIDDTKIKQFGTPQNFDDKVTQNVGMELSSKGKSSSLEVSEKSLSEMSRLLNSYREQMDKLRENKARTKRESDNFEPHEILHQEQRNDLPGIFPKEASPKILEEKDSPLQETVLKSTESPSFDREQFQENATQKLEQQVKTLQKELKTKEAELENTEITCKNLETEKQSLKQSLLSLMEKLSHLEKSQSKKNVSIAEELNVASARATDLEKRLQEYSEKLSKAEATIASKESHIYNMRKASKDLDELRDLKRDAEQRAARIQLELSAVQKLYKEEQLLRKKYFNMVEDMKGKIRVYARWRPLSEKEKSEDPNPGVIAINDSTLRYEQRIQNETELNFDRVFDDTASQEDVFADVQHLIQSAVDGYNVCIFAYGQTGSGKTYTILGSVENPGLTPRAISELFSIVDRERERYFFHLKVYMLELYLDSLVDLLAPPSTAPKRLEVKQDSKGTMYVQNAELCSVRSRQELEHIIQAGLRRRHTSSTNMNEESSRSHLILSIIIESTDIKTNIRSKGKLSFVDLAGSERVKKSGVSGQHLKEAQSINKALTSLGNVIEALQRTDKVVPYRENMLTRLMSDSLGGNAKTLMFVNISPARSNLDETHSALSYACRVKHVTNTVSRNADTREIARLKHTIQQLTRGRKFEEIDFAEIEDKKHT